MGILQSTDGKIINYPHKISEYNSQKVIKNAMGAHEVVSSPEDSSPRILRSVSFDNDFAYKKIQAALKDLKHGEDLPEIAYIGVEAAEVIDNRVFCSVSQVKVVLEYFPITLEDAIRGGHIPLFFSNEAKFWKLLFDLTAAIDFGVQNKFSCAHAMHPRAICWAEGQERWKLIHSGLILESNYSEAMAGNLHFCSPEIFSNLNSQAGKRNLEAAGKSDLFSLGLIILFIILAGEKKINMANVYNRMSGQVDGFYLQEKVACLAEKGYSEIFVRVLGEFLQEFDHLRPDSGDFFDQLGSYRPQLEDENYRGHRKIFENYMEMKSSNVFASTNRPIVSNNDSFYESDIRKSSGSLFQRRSSIDRVKGTPPRR